MYNFAFKSKQGVKYEEIPIVLDFVLITDAFDICHICDIANQSGTHVTVMPTITTNSTKYKRNAQRAA